jgi:hypothetical protein
MATFAFEHHADLPDRAFIDVDGTYSVVIATGDRDDARL